MRGSLIAFEGLDQSGKQTQAESLRDRLAASGRKVQLLSFPDYESPVGSEIKRVLHGEGEHMPDVMQLLYITNRYEYRTKIAAWLAEGVILLSDRYIASSVAYGEAQGLDPAWLQDIQRFLPPPDLTILLDIAPETAVRRKAAGRDRYERDLDLLLRVRQSYRRQASDPRWVLVNGEQPKADVTRDVLSAAATRLGLR
jgi:dTMP kinase